MHGLYAPGFSGIRVRVALENPRITRANPYEHRHVVRRHDELDDDIAVT